MNRLASVHDIEAAIREEEAERERGRGRARTKRREQPSKDEPESDWRAGLMLTKSGVPRSILTNALVALRGAPEWVGVLRFNELTGQVEAAKGTPWGYAGEWSDEQDSLTAEWLQRESILVPSQVAHEAVGVVARQDRYHPVRRWLRSLEWDGKTRLAHWLTDYLGVAPSGYVSEVGRCALVSAVARAMRPGCKADTMLILEGEQGALKSQACAILGGAWYADQIGDLASRDASIAVQRIWLLEFGELNGLRRSETNAIKAFLSRTSDYYRQPYGRVAESFPRGCWFIGTANGDHYLKDETGGRRFWPVEVGTINLDALRADRDQLFAEALHEFEDGRIWWLEGAELVAAAREQQDKRYQEDAWHQLVEEYVRYRDECSISEVFVEVLRLERGRWGQPEQNRIAAIFQRLGWRRAQRRVNGVRSWVYVPPVTTVTGSVTSMGDEVVTG